VLAAVAAAVPARADRIRTRAGIGYEGKIVGMDADGLVLEYAGGKRAIPLGEIGSIRVDQDPDLERAEEAYAKGLAGGPKAVQEFAEAERLYKGMIQRGVPPWMRALVDLRLYKLYADAGRVPEALDVFLALAENQPTLVANSKLPKPKPDDGAANREMLGKVEEALKRAGDKAYAGELKSFRVALMLLGGAPEQTLLSQLDSLFAADKIAEAERMLNQVRSTLAKDSPQEMAYYTARVLAARGQHVQAALQFMRVPILYADKDPKRTAEALWRAGVAMKTANLPDGEISKVFHEAVQNYPDTEGAKQAKQELARLGVPKG